MTTLTLASTLLALSITLAPAAQNLLRVGPGARFTDLQPAIDAAQPGDRIVVALGHYNMAVAQPIVISKALSIVADGADPLGITRATVHHGVRCVGIPAGQTVMLANLRIVSRDLPGIRGLTALDVTDCPGTVAVHSCDLFSSGTHDTLGRALYLSDPVVWMARATVVLSSIRTFGGWGSPTLAGTDCTMFLDQSGTSAAYFGYTIEGRQPFVWDPTGSIALGPASSAAAFTRSFVSITGATLLGGFAIPGAGAYPRGAPALQMTGGELHFVGTSLMGGAGVNSQTGPGGDGGDGLVHQSTVFVGANVQFTGGAGGRGTPAGTAGTPVVGATPAPAPVPLLACAREPALSEAITFTSTLPTPFLYWVLGSTAAPGALPGVRGLLLHDPNSPIYVEGPGSRSQFVLAPPDLPGAYLFVQTMAIDPVTLEAFFSTPCAAAIRGR